MQKLVARPEVAMYTPDEGLEEVRTEVARWYARRYAGAPAAQNICLTIGASQAFWLAMLLVAKAGDEVIVQVPAYFDHPMALDTLGIKPVFVPAAADGGSDIKTIVRHVTPLTRAIVVVTPSNPTGRVLSSAENEELYQCASAHNLALVLDETYNAFLPPDQEPHHLFSKPDWGDTFIHLASFGKTFALTGYRAGALVAGEELIRQALKVQDSMVVCQPRITQGALAWGCRNLDSWVAYNAERMRERHDTFRALFEDAGHRFELSASGAFFAWVRHPWPEMDSWQVARLLAEKGDLICLPGDAFGPGQQRYLRLAFGNLKCEDMPAAVERFGAISPPRG
jgi:aspartate/methionine/tyrosine aminotransferase